MWYQVADSLAMPQSRQEKNITTMRTDGFEANDILSALQRQHDEAVMLRSLGNWMGVEFHPKSMPLPGGGVMEIDGYSSQANAVCEVCTNEGPMSPEEEEMVLLNACKLRYFAQAMGNTVRQILLFRDRSVAQGFCNSNRVLDAMGDSAVEVCVITRAAA